MHQSPSEPKISFRDKGDIRKHSVTTDEMRQKQHQEELRRRRLLEMKLLARRRQRQREVKDDLESELKSHEEQNREVLAKARHNEVKKAELKLIQESFENSNEQDSITLVKSGTSQSLWLKSLFLPSKWVTLYKSYK